MNKTALYLASILILGLVITGFLFRDSLPFFHTRQQQAENSLLTEQSLTPLKFGFLQMGWSATEIIAEEDLLKPLGWEVEYTPIAGSPPNLINAFAANQFDLVQMSTLLVAKMYEQGIPVQIVSTAAGSVSSIVVPQNSSIQNIQDLQGKRVGSIVGSTTFQDMEAQLSSVAGVNLQQDSIVIPASSPPELVGLLANGEVDAIIGWEPVTSQLVKTENYRYLIKHDQLWKQFCNCEDDFIHIVYIVNPDFSSKHPQIVEDISKAQKQARNLWHQDKQLAAQHIQAITQLDKEDIQFAMDQTHAILAGLDNTHKNTILTYFTSMKKAGVLKDDVWLDSSEAEQVLFHQN